MIFVFGLLGLAPSTVFFLGFAAWVMGNDDLKAMAAGRMDRRGERLTCWGRTLGIIGVVANILWISKGIPLDGVGRVVGSP